MLLFRSEEHAERWCEVRGRSLGAVVPLAATWELAKAWHLDRRDPAWRRRTVEESEALLHSLELTDPFWRLR